MKKPITPIIPSARQVRAIRAWLSVKQPDFARSCSISHSALADFELGRRETTKEIRLSIARHVATLKIKFTDGNMILPE